MEVYNTLLKKVSQDVIKIISLSNNQVQRSIDEWEKPIISHHLNESKLPGKINLLLLYIRFILD